MPLIKYGKNPETGLWATDDGELTGETWQDVYQAIRAKLAPERPVSIHDCPFAPDRRFCVWIKLGQRPAAPGAPAPPDDGKVIVDPDEIKPIIDSDNDSDNNDDGGDFSLFDD